MERWKKEGKKDGKKEAFAQRSRGRRLSSSALQQHGEKCVNPSQRCCTFLCWWRQLGGHGFDKTHALKMDASLFLRTERKSQYWPIENLRYKKKNSWSNFSDTFKRLLVPFHIIRLLIWEFNLGPTQQQRGWNPCGQSWLAGWRRGQHTLFNIRDKAQREQDGSQVETQTLGGGGHNPGGQPQRRLNMMRPMKPTCSFRWTWASLSWWGY